MKVLPYNPSWTAWEVNTFEKGNQKYGVYLDNVGLPFAGGELSIQNIIWTLDSYKDLHDQMLPHGTEQAYAYLQPRVGAQYPYVVVFGAQATIAKWLQGVVITKALIDEIEPVMHDHFKYNGRVWSRAKWDYIVDNFGGKLPIRIKGLPEGTVIPIDNMILSVESTDPSGKCAWLPCALETVLQSGVWYATTAATRAHVITSIIRDFFKDTVDDDMQWLADYYMHDFGQRAATCMEQAGIGGGSVLISTKGTDTKMAIPTVVNYYGANRFDLCHSVPATEHAITCALGRKRELEITNQFIDTFPNGVASDVGDGYSIVEKVKAVCTVLKAKIMARNGKYVIRPDSPRFKGDTAANQILWIVQELWAAYGGTINKKGYKVLDSHVGVIYGDSLTEKDIQEALQLLKDNGFAASASVYGCGGYLIQKINRDTERFKFAASCYYRDGKWEPVQKDPLDPTKKSKAGRLKVVRWVGAHGGGFETVDESDPRPDEMITIFENGEFVNTTTFAEVKQRATARIPEWLLAKN